jgi:hypothetical protein
MFCNWNELIINPLTRIKWRASLVPAAAVIPAPLAYIKIVAVKTFEVDYCSVRVLLHQVNGCNHFPITWTRICLNTQMDSIRYLSLGLSLLFSSAYYYLEQIKVLKAGFYMPWIFLHGIMEKDLGLNFLNKIFYWFDKDQEVMINRSSWGH